MYFFNKIDKEYELMSNAETNANSKNFLKKFQSWYVPRILKYTSERKAELFNKATSLIEDGEFLSVIRILISNTYVPFIIVLLFYREFKSSRSFTSVITCS